MKTAHQVTIYFVITLFTDLHGSNFLLDETSDVHVEHNSDTLILQHMHHTHYDTSDTIQGMH